MLYHRQFQNISFMFSFEIPQLVSFDFQEEIVSRSFPCLRSQEGHIKLSLTGCCNSN